jgi:hypothetical protein
MSEKHTHEYTKEVIQKSPLRGGGLHHIKQRKCTIKIAGKVCGAVKPYDVERVR